MKTMKRWIITSISILIIFSIGILIMPYVQNGYWMFREFIEPDVHDRIEKEWSNKSSEFLLKRLKSKVRMYSGTASYILVKRKEKISVPIFLELINSRNEQRRISAFIALGELGDERAIKPLMDIVKTGRKHRGYLNALDALSIMHYEELYPEILKLAKDGYHTSWVVGMLERYPEKKETLPTLKHIADNDPEWYIQDKAKSAITKIQK